MTDKTEREIREIERPATIFCDIDGTLLKHFGTTIDIYPLKDKAELLSGVLEKFEEWDLKGYNIILVTGRREGLRELTKKQLNNFGIIYDTLIMGIGGGKRYLINDTKPDSNEPTCFGITVKRNVGLENVKI
jgi:hypothetical protein